MLLTLLFLVSMKAGPNEAEKLFHDMEKKISSAKTVECSVEGKIEAENMAFDVKASLVFAEGSKVHVEMTMNAPKKTKFAVISNGIKMRSIVDGKTEDVKGSPKKLGEDTQKMFSRGGILLPFFTARKSDQEEEGMEFEFTTSDFTLGKKEKVGDKEAQVIQYTLSSKSLKDPFAITVWIDAKTNLPLKRTIKVEKGSITETYSKLNLDEKIDPKKFELPKE